jgi:hypothetical protein
VTAIGYAARLRGRARLACAGLAVAITAIYFGWPGSLWGIASNPGAFTLGLIWMPPNTNPGTYYRLGDRPWFAEYHWHGLELLTGNLYVLTGIGLLIVLAVLAGLAGLSVRRARKRPVTTTATTAATLASSVAGAQNVMMS